MINRIMIYFYNKEQFQQMKNTQQKDYQWDIFNESPLKKYNSKHFHNQTTQNMLGFNPHFSSPERKPRIYHNRYQKTDNPELSIKQLLVIIPGQNDIKSAQDKYSRGGSPIIEKIAKNTNTNTKNDNKNPCFQQNQIFSHSKRHKRERIIINRLSNKLQSIQERAKIIRHISTKLKPITDSRSKQDNHGENATDMSIKFNITGIKDARITKQIFNINKKYNSNPKLKDEKGQYYRLGQQTNLCNVFNIQSIQPSSSYSTQKVSNTILKKIRRCTQPSMESQQSPIKIQEHQILNKIKSQNKNKSKHLQLNEQNNTNTNTRIFMPKIKKINYCQIKKNRKFILPFQTYYYRDFIWKINYSYQLLIEPPLEYQHRLKVYVGKGNNSCMVRGLISRRYWFAFTDKLEQANFVWTQLKQLEYFKLQNKSQFIPEKLQNQQQYQHESFFTQNDIKTFKKYWQNHMKVEQYNDERLISRSKYFKFTRNIKNEDLKIGKMHNHFKNNYIIGNKKALFYTMKNYYTNNQINPFDYLPLTFHIVKGPEDPSFLQFIRYYHKRNKQIRKSAQDKQNLWIVKPGQNTNRGQGIKLCMNLKQIKQIIKNKQKWPDGTDKTYIIQSYIEKPLLYKKRKFDIRHYLLISCINGCIKGYWYEAGYIRTSSSQYKLNNSKQSVHLTNDAIQKYLPDYGKFQKGNKLSYDHLDKYIEKYHQGKTFYQNVYPHMKKIGTDIIKASSRYLDTDRLQNNFEIFGLDFMIDQDLNVWLIQVNSNPCLQLSCPLLAQIIPNFIQNVLQVTLDAMYPPPIRYSPKIPRYLTNMEQMNKFELVFDQRIQEGFNGNENVLNTKMLAQEDDVFEDDGSEWEDS